MPLTCVEWEDGCARAGRQVLHSSSEPVSVLDSERDPQSPRPGAEGRLTLSKKSGRWRGWCQEWVWRPKWSCPLEGAP